MASMWVIVTFAIVMGVLLFSNFWLLREVDDLQYQLEALHKDVAALDERVCGLMYSADDDRLSHNV